MMHLIIDNTLPIDLPDLYEGIEDNRPVRGRVLRTGLLGRARALFHGLGPKGEHPSRKAMSEK